MLKKRWNPLKTLGFALLAIVFAVNTTEIKAEPRSADELLSTQYGIILALSDDQPLTQPKVSLQQHKSALSLLFKDSDKRRSEIILAVEDAATIWKEKLNLAAATLKKSSYSITAPEVIGKLADLKTASIDLDIWIRSASAEVKDPFNRNADIKVFWAMANLQIGRLGAALAIAETMPYSCAANIIIGHLRYEEGKIAAAQESFSADCRAKKQLRSFAEARAKATIGQQDRLNVKVPTIPLSSVYKIQPQQNAIPPGPLRDTSKMSQWDIAFGLLTPTQLPDRPSSGPTYEVSGGLTESDFKAVLMANINTLNQSSAMMRSRYVMFNGWVTLEWRVNANGEVTDPHIVGVSLKDIDKPGQLELLARLRRAVSGWKFPQSKDGKPTKIKLRYGCDQC